MKKSIFTTYVILACISFSITTSLKATPLKTNIEATLSLHSYSFNAKKKSHFIINGQKESVTRGLTLIHFNTASTFEFKTFDTYSSQPALDELVTLLNTLIASKAAFALLAHDSAVSGSLKNQPALKALGLEKLAGLKSRQAYVMHHIADGIFEKVDDTALAIGLSLPQSINDDIIYFPKETFEFEDSFDRYIAHAGGAVDGHSYTNTKNALDANYEKGFRLFELDIIYTSDNEPVAAHDWKMWSRFTEYQGDLPPSLAEFKQHNIYGDYVTLDMEGINAWFAAHPDAILVTDKVNDPIAFANAFVDKKRLMMELFSPYAIEKALENGIEPMISQDALLKLQGDKVDYLRINDIRYASVSRRIILKEKKLMLALRDNGIKVYVYNVNFDEGKDENYVYENELGLVFGMYADNWFDD